MGTPSCLFWAGHATELFHVASASCLTPRSRPMRIVKTGWAVSSLAFLTAASGAAHGQRAQPERVAVIGEANGAPEYSLGVVADVAFGVDGEIIVLDAQWGQVRVYGQDGTFLRSFGRSGEGPGEFILPVTMTVTSGRVRVFDARLQRIVTFSVAGEHISTERVDWGRSDFAIPLRFGHMLTGNRNTTSISHELTTLAQEPRSVIVRRAASLRALTSRAVVLMHGRSDRADTIFRYDHGRVLRYIEGGAAGTAGRTFGKGMAWAASGDSVIATIDAWRGTVRFHEVTPDGLRLIRSGQIPVTPRPLEMRDWLWATAEDDANRTLTRRILHHDGPPFMAQLADPVFSDHGTLWVRRLGSDPETQWSQERTEYLLIPIDDRAQSVVVIPGGVNIKAIRGDLVAVVGRGEFDVPIVEIWRLPGCRTGC